MRPKFPASFWGWCVAVVLCWGAIVHAAERHPLIGANREQVLSQYGEPRSNAVVGNRELMFYPKERLTLRDGVVVDVERLAEPAKRSSVPAPVPAPSDSAASTTAALATAEARPESGPEAPPTRPSVATEPPATAIEPAPAPSEPKLEIKRVLPPGTSSPRVVPKQTTKKAAPALPAPTPSTAPVARSGSAPVASSSAPSTVRSAPTAPISAPNVPESAPAARENEPSPATTALPVMDNAPEEAKDNESVSKKDAAKRINDVKAARRRLEQAEAENDDTTENFFTTRTYIFALVIIGAGAAYLYWRSRQRQIELAATAVSRTPFSAPLTPGSGAIFKSDLISKLEWKRFEELVAAYYSKTGVVATRTKQGPSAPVHIKISWKGESRPFALVQCIAHPNGLVDAKPLQELFTVLTAEDIRRGYVVTTGKFNVAARDLAEEKHVTLLPGEIFLEKLNALPDAARGELMQEITAGDFTTPSCPKCEAKMVRSPDDPSVWRCAAHPDQQITA